MQKKAQSEVITTVLIILLVLAAIFIVWMAVKGMLNKKVGEAGSQADCIGLDLSIASVTTGTGSAAKVVITRNSGGTESGTTPVVLVNGVSKTVLCAPNSIPQLGSATCNLSGTDTIATNDNVTAGLKIGDFACPTTAVKVA